MNRSKALIIGTLVGIAVLIGAAWGGTQLYASYQMKKIVARVQEENPGTIVKYGSYYFQPIGMKWVIKDLVLENNLKQVDVKMKKATVNAFCDLNNSVSRNCKSEFEGISIGGKDPDIQEMITKFENKLGTPMNLDVKFVQSYEPAKNFAVISDVEISQKDLFKTTIKASFEGLDLEALTQSLKATMAQGDLQNNAAGMMFMYMSLLSNTQINLVSIKLEVEKKMGELVKEGYKKEPAYVSKETFPELVAFLEDPKSFYAVIQPVKNKNISALIADERSQYGVRGWVELLGAQLNINGKDVDIVAVVERSSPKMAGAKSDQRDDGKRELKIKRTIAE